MNKTVNIVIYLWSMCIFLLLKMDFDFIVLNTSEFHSKKENLTSFIVMCGERTQPGYSSSADFWLLTDWVYDSFLLLALGIDSLGTLH